MLCFHVNHVQVVSMLSCCYRNKVQTLNQLDADSRKLRDLDALGPLVAILAVARTATAQGPAAS